MTHHTTELRERPTTAIGKAARNECLVTPSGLAVPELQQVNALDPSPLTDAAGAANRLTVSHAGVATVRQPTAAGAYSSLSPPPFPSHWTAADRQWFVDNLPENG